jgi:hypothetical protein
MMKLLNCCQARWSQFLSQFNFKIIYRPSTTGSKPDALTRRSGDLHEEGDDCSLENQTTIIKPENILHVSAISLPNTPPLAILLPTLPLLTPLFTEEYNNDPFPNKILRILQEGVKQCREISLAEYDADNDLLHYRQLIWVPNYEL